MKSFYTQYIDGKNVQPGKKQLYDGLISNSKSILKTIKFYFKYIRPSLIYCPQSSFRRHHRKKNHCSNLVHPCGPLATGFLPSINSVYFSIENKIGPIFPCSYVVWYPCYRANNRILPVRTGLNSIQNYLKFIRSLC